MTSARPVSPRAAAELMAQGAALVDIRETDERARASIPDSHHAPLSTLGTPLPIGGTTPVIFHCRSGGRTATNADRLAATTSAPVYLLSGGIDAWRAAGLPVTTDRRQPIELMRQVQITAGLLILAGILLGSLVAPGFYGLSALVGAGLTFAGVTGWCGMARLLERMPWNRRATAAA